MHGSPHSAFHLFIDEHILNCVQKHTINHGKNNDSDSNLHLDKLESFIGLQLARVVLVGRKTPIKQLWSKDWGQQIFRNIMSRDRYAKIRKHLRFDDFLRRRQRRETDKFCVISELWNTFMENCKKYYKQLFLCKTFSFSFLLQNFFFFEQLFLLTNNFFFAKLDAPLFNAWQTSQTNLV